MSTRGVEVSVCRTPVGHVRAQDFALRELLLPSPGAGEVLVRNLWMSIDPYMLLVLSRQDGFVAAVQPGDVLQGAALGVVEESWDPQLPVGTTVLSQLGWRSHFIAARAALTVVDPGPQPQWHLGLLGLTGITAQVGIESVLQPRAGETLFVSGASGAVGSVAVQLAKLRGARVLGACSSPAKAAWLRDVAGIDAVVDYTRELIDDFLRRAAPDGVDAYFDNVGGPVLDCLLRHMKPYGRVALCGAMSRYESEDYRQGPSDFFTVIEKSLTLRGFNAFLLSVDEAANSVAWIRQRALAGQIISCETVVDGLERAAEAFAALFEGGHAGKLLVRVQAESV